MSAMGLGRKSFARQFSKTLLLSPLEKKGKEKGNVERFEKLGAL